MHDINAQVEQLKLDLEGEIKKRKILDQLIISQKSELKLQDQGELEAPTADRKDAVRIDRLILCFGLEWSRRTEERSVSFPLEERAIYKYRSKNRRDEPGKADKEGQGAQRRTNRNQDESR